MKPIFNFMIRFIVAAFGASIVAVTSVLAGYTVDTGAILGVMTLFYVLNVKTDRSEVI